MRSEIESSFTSNHLIRKYDVKNLKEVYIAVKSIEGKNLYGNSNEASTYILKSHWIKSGMQTPYDVFYVPDDGQIEYFFSTYQNELKFRIKFLLCQDKPCNQALGKAFKSSIKFYQYGIRISSSSDSVESSVTCFINGDQALMNSSLSEYYQWNLLTDPFAEATYFFIDLDKVAFNRSTPYYAKAFAQVYVTEGNHEQPYTFFYRTTEFYPEGKFVEEKSSSNFSFIFVLVLLGFLIMIAALFFFRKYKTTEKQLNYELQDVTKVARLEPKNQREYIGLSNTEA